MHVTIVARAPTTVDTPASGPQETSVLLHWQSESDCERFAQQLAELLRPALASGGSALIELRGTLGAGKTTLTRHLLRALGVQGRIKSPSYAVVEPHEAQGLHMWHFDFYRFAEPREWEDAGFRDLFAAPGLKLVEWPDKAEGLLPAADLKLDLDTVADEHRAVQLRSGTPQGLAWQARLQEAA
jgi:tRNA threonylcarbamoyladenosine biosynthesis protein TsaE